jgi:hypothetical protein
MGEVNLVLDELCQNYVQRWETVEDVMQFVMSLAGTLRKSFLVNISAVCWCV